MWRRRSNGSHAATGRPRTIDLAGVRHEQPVDQLEDGALAGAAAARRGRGFRPAPTSRSRPCRTWVLAPFESNTAEGDSSVHMALLSRLEAIDKRAGRRRERRARSSSKSNPPSRIEMPTSPRTPKRRRPGRTTTSRRRRRDTRRPLRPGRPPRAVRADSRRRRTRTGPSRRPAPPKFQTTEPSKTYWLSVSSMVVSGAFSASPLDAQLVHRAREPQPAFDDERGRHDEADPRDCTPNACRDFARRS